jgi:hypothetical protein
VGQARGAGGRGPAGHAGIVLFLDWVLQVTTGRSLIDIGYGNKRRLIIVPAWCVASGVVGVLAVLLQIVQTTSLAAITVAIGWPLVFAKIVELGSSSPVQPLAAEAKER